MKKITLEDLKKRLAKQRAKLDQMKKDWSITKQGSRYGDEYLEMQIKVYVQTIQNLEKIIKRWEKEGK